MNHLKDQSHPKILGILGSGQLARMTAMAASELGLLTHIYCNDESLSPAQQVATFTTKGSFDDWQNVLSFCDQCDVVTLENEFLDQSLLEEITRHAPLKLFPSALTFSKIGDKVSEKKTFIKADLLVAAYAQVNSVAEALAFAEKYHFPIVLKASKGGYDGYGNATIRNANELRQKFDLFKGEKLVEAHIDFEKELSVIVARNRDGESQVYPVTETIQENHICHYVLAPAAIDPTLAEKAKEIALRAMEAIDGVGVFAFEFFLTKNLDLYLNECAPRPHNSGHFTMDACITGQFHNHVRSVMNYPLGSTKLNSSNAAMLNLLGTQDAQAKLSPMEKFLSIEDGHLHLYGKKQSRRGRKMGHFTLIGENREALMSTLRELKEVYQL